MALFRLIAVIFIVAGLMCVGYDIIASMQGGQGFRAISLDSTWGLFSQSSLESFHQWYAAKVPNPGPGIIGSILSFPAFAVFGVIGVLLGLLFQRRDRYAAD